MTEHVPPWHGITDAAAREAIDQARDSYTAMLAAGYTPISEAGYDALAARLPSVTGLSWETAGTLAGGEITIVTRPGAGDPAVDCPNTLRAAEAAAKPRRRKPKRRKRGKK